MRSLVIYYSHSGSTTKVSHEFFNRLCVYGESDIYQLEYAAQKRNLILRLFYKFYPKAVKLCPVFTDLSDWDVLFLGIPVIAGTPSSSILKYILLSSKLEGKKVICCYVYGFKANAKKCSMRINKELQKKGNFQIVPAFVSWADASNQEILESTIKKTLREAGIS